MKTVSVIADYEIIEELGDSPQATIYKVCQKQNQARLLALKVLKAAFLSENKG